MGTNRQEGILLSLCFSLEVKVYGTKTARIRRKSIVLCQGSERMA